MLLFIFILIGCAKSTQPMDIVPILEQFKKDSIQYGTNYDPYSVTIQYSDNLDVEIAGFCSNGAISINKTKWNNLDDNIQQQLVIYHELGHCLLGKNHSTDENDIMYKTIPETIYFNGLKNQMLQRFFH